jgi:hypothetical protein
VAELRKFLDPAYMDEMTLTDEAITDIILAGNQSSSYIVCSRDRFTNIFIGQRYHKIVCHERKITKLDFI